MFPGEYVPRCPRPKFRSFLFQPMSASISLESPIFLTRQLVTIPEDEENPSAVYCPICSCNRTVTIENQVITVDCGHLIPCTECRDYNIEKVLRCESCCRGITGKWVEGCNESCPRFEETTKVSALCSICSSHLRKEARCCRNTPPMGICKQKIRSKTAVFVQNPKLVKNPTPKDRPCSHFSLCQFCKKSIVKGHRSSTACKSCKSKVAEGSMSPSKKRNRIQFCLETGINQYVPPTKAKCASPSSLDALAKIAEVESKEESKTDKKDAAVPFADLKRIPVHSLLS
uniref:RING-type domain-containing protein n=1 Tax=Vannella robusta TaxID=1487602 RepID=A0A7S4ML02_9EUKA|mmetsp:Transcript_25492/g.32463  ORF Transcript_25492/g.32463 Transcript_25492/m.32463 type:complete len:286 (+) Transcript_25492:5-862(+)